MGRSYVVSVQWRHFVPLVWHCQWGNDQKRLVHMEELLTNWQVFCSAGVRLQICGSQIWGFFEVFDGENIINEQFTMFPCRRLATRGFDFRIFELKSEGKLSIVKAKSISKEQLTMYTCWGLAPQGLDPWIFEVKSERNCVFWRAKSMLNEWLTMGPPAVLAPQGLHLGIFKVSSEKNLAFWRKEIV